MEKAGGGQVVDAAVLIRVQAEHIAHVVLQVRAIGDVIRQIHGAALIHELLAVDRARAHNDIRIRIGSQHQVELLVRVAIGGDDLVFHVEVFQHIGLHVFDAQILLFARGKVAGIVEDVDAQRFLRHFPAEGVLFRHGGRAQRERQNHDQCQCSFQHSNLLLFLHNISVRYRYYIQKEMAL